MVLENDAKIICTKSELFSVKKFFMSRYTYCKFYLK